MPIANVIYVERIRDMLLAAGTSGVKQKDITLKLLHQMNAEEIKTQLERWRSVGAVQKFRIDEVPYRPITMWRATERLAETDEKGETYVY